MISESAMPSGPLVAFYGDDFTGSSAAMEVLAFAGLDTILFLEPPTAERLAEVTTHYRGIGIAGIARARDPAWMDANLPPIFELLGQAGAPIVHYKICSTFDSSPQIGSIGRAAEIGLRQFGRWIPMVVSDPGMGRFQAFGNLFANANGVAYRLDRHPTMSNHPVTPMHEADLGLHLAHQTSLNVGLVDFASVKRGETDSVLAAELAKGANIVSIDVLDLETLQEAGRLIWDHGGSSLVLGSQGVEQALVAYWRASGILDVAARPRQVGKVDQLAVVSGSVSPVTATQLNHAGENGFKLIAFDTTQAVAEYSLLVETERCIQEALKALSDGLDPLVFTAEGPGDVRVLALHAATKAHGAQLSEVNDRVGAALGDILSALIRQAGLRRVVISGGDTSGRAASRLGIEALTALAPISPGVPLCRAHSVDPAIDGLEIALKGGQTGAENFFSIVRGD